MAEVMQASNATETVIVNYFQIFISAHSALQAHKSTDPCAGNK